MTRGTRSPLLFKGFHYGFFDSGYVVYCLMPCHWSCICTTLLHKWNTDTSLLGDWRSIKKMHSA